MTELFPYQEIGAQWLAKVGRGLLADDPGLGKSAQAIAAAKILRSPYTLVICPASVVENWKREIERFWPECPAWNVISYDRATRDHKKVDWAGSGAGVLIVDEAHYLKSRTAKRTKAVFGDKCDGIDGYIERIQHVFLLTGTPMPNNPSELWPMLRAVMPDTIIGLKSGKPVAYWPFAMRYCKMERNYLGHDTIVGGKNLPELRERMKPFVLRRKKSDVLPDLPAIRSDVLPLSSDAAIQAIRAAESGSDLERIREALQSGGIAALSAIAPHVATMRRSVGLAKVGVVADWVRDQLDGGLKKIVLFAQHTDVIDALDRAVTASGYNAVTLDGRTLGRWRQDAVDSFQHDPQLQVFIGQIQAAGTGITLTAASDLVFVESSWTPTDNEQAAMRIHRIGQKNACTVRFATISGSIDEQIQRACARKLEDIRALFV